MNLGENNDTAFIYRVLEYIHCNLSGDLNLEKLAAIANYSPFHFQRIFTKITGESPKQYIIRLRLEKAAHYIVVFPNFSLTEISIDAGFSSLSIFSRAFKSYFGLSPNDYKNMPPDEFRKICKTDSKKSKITTAFSSEFWRINFSQADMTELENRIDFKVKKLQQKKLYFLQTVLESPEAITIAFRKLCQWAEPRALIGPGTEFFGILLDIPLITPLEKCRYKVCIASDSLVAGNKNFGSMKIDPALFVSYQMKGDIYAVVKSLVYFNHHWLPNSGYMVRDVTGFELFAENPANKPVEQINREILIPVKPA